MATLRDSDPLIHSRRGEVRSCNPYLLRTNQTINDNYL